jgi:hypothetical protein
MLNIALFDAATNCARDGATAIVTLRSGVQLEGKLERPYPNPTTGHLKTKDGGWITFCVEEVAAVEARP